MNSASIQKKIQHLYLRAGFGESVSTINNSLNKSIAHLVQKLFDDSKIFADLSLDAQSDLNTDQKESKETSKKDKKDLKKQSREDIRDLNIAWINKMSYDKAQLREKMTLFWHGHFACRTNYGVFCENQNNLIRKNALGKFGDLLNGVSRDPAMLQFLNGQQNKKASPNENFSREVMELFTMGRGNYTERDIKEAARAFTGWGFDKNGKFIFREKVHDTDNKTFLGRTGNFNGEDIINIILEKRETADFITEKIYKFFVNEKVNKEVISELSKKFYESEYKIESLLRNIFMSDWFYDKENIGTMIKSPVEFILGMMRTFNIDFINTKPLLNIQKMMGQLLFNPPNVAGWPGGKSWINTSTLILRLKLPEIIFKSSNLSFDYKDDPPEMGESYKEISKKEKKQYKQMSTRIDLKNFVNEFSEYDNDEIAEKLIESLLQINLDSKKIKLIKSYSDFTSKFNLIKSLTLKIISMPEYQLS